MAKETKTQLLTLETESMAIYRGDRLKDLSTKILRWTPENFSVLYKAEHDFLPMLRVSIYKKERRVHTQWIGKPGYIPGGTFIQEEVHFLEECFELTLGNAIILRRKLRETFAAHVDFHDPSVEREPEEPVRIEHDDKVRSDPSQGGIQHA